MRGTFEPIPHDPLVHQWAAKSVIHPSDPSPHLWERVWVRRPFRSNTPCVPSPHLWERAGVRGDFLSNAGPIRQETWFERQNMLTSINS